MERIEIKADFVVDEAGSVEGIAWPFEAGPDSIGDLIDRGAFTVKQIPLPMLDSHNPEAPIGVWDEVGETDEGLRVKGRLLVADVQRAREVRALIREKAITGLSIGYRTTKAAPRKGGGRTISRLDLYEVSPVVMPAHPAARITSAKAASAATQEGHVAETEHQEAAPDFAAIESKMAEVAETVKGFDKLVERLDKLEAKANRPGGGKAEDQDAVIERKAFAAYLRSGSRPPAADELKTLTVSSDPQGGYLAPTEMSTEFIRDLVEFSPIRSLASVRSTAAPAVQYPRRTGITNAKWKGETQTQEASEPSFGQTEVPIRELNTYVDVSNQLLADSAGQAEAEVRLALAEDFGHKEGLAFVKGANVLEPEGLLSNADVAYTFTGNASTLGTAPADLLIDVMYAMPAAYRSRGTWLMNGKTLAAVRKLKDGTTGVFLWQPSYAAGQPETILGRPVVEVPDMPDVGSAAEPIIFGDIATAYRIVDRVGLSILVNPYLRATEGITRIHATRRVGAAVVQPAALRKVRCATS